MKRFVLFTLCFLLVLCPLVGCEKISTQTPPGDTMNILAIGSYGKDILTYLEPLAAAGGYPVNAAYLDVPGSTLRTLAKAFSSNSNSFTYYEADGTAFTSQEGVTADEILSRDWDVVILQQAVVFSGFRSTYDADLKYLTDFIHDKTDAKLYWNMSWAAEDSLTDETLSTFYNYYDAGTMYNAIIDCLETGIVGNEAFSGWIPSGAVIEQIRGQYGAMTANGHNLSAEEGLLAASLTTINTLLPDYDLKKATCDQISGDALSVIISAVESNCKSGTIPKKTEVAAIPANENADITIGQAVSPMRLHFPDLAVLNDGTVIVGAYENIYHKPTEGYQEGVGRLLLWSSSDNGATWNYDAPLLIIDQAQIEAWGLAELSNRYEAIQSGNTNYVFMADPRDPNLSVVNADMDGDGAAEEVLLYTFWIKFYTETQTTNKCYMIHSTDGGRTWSMPQNLVQVTGIDIVKRGDIASFSNGQILIPYYKGKRAGGLLMEYDPGLGEWVLLHDSEVTNFETEESENFNEVSFVATNPDSNTVFAYCRENGTVLRSDDRGVTWDLLANEDGLIHQPGFTVLDENRAYVTWALTAVRPRPTYGKVFDVTKGWDATTAQLHYASPVTERHDTGDPSCALLADGRVLVICYDTAYRSVVGVYVDPNK